MASDRFAPRRRRTTFRPELVGQARMLAALGATDTQIATDLGVDEEIFKRWKERHSRFRRAVEAGRTEADTRGAGSLSSRAAAFETAAKSLLGTAPFKKRQRAVDGGRSAPDPTTLIALLKHGLPRAAEDGHSGGEGKPAAEEHKAPKMSTVDVARRIAFIFAKAEHDLRTERTSAPSSFLSSSTTSDGVN